MEKKCPFLPPEITDNIKYLASNIKDLLKICFIPTLTQLIEYKNPITIYVDQNVYKILENKYEIIKKLESKDFNNLYFTKIDLDLKTPINEVHVYLKDGYSEKDLTLPNPIIEKPTNYYFYGSSTTFPMIRYSALDNKNDITVDLTGLTGLPELELQGKFQFMQKNLTQIRLPENIKSLKWRTFKDCEKLKEVTLPPNVISLGENCFANCTNLTEINLSMITNICNGCFKDCKSLKTVDLSSITNIGCSCFDGCTMLQKVKGNLSDKVNTYFKKLNRYMNFEEKTEEEKTEEEKTEEEKAKGGKKSQPYLKKSQKKSQKKSKKKSLKKKEKKTSKKESQKKSTKLSKKSTKLSKKSAKKK